MEVNEQTLYDDELLNILPDGVIILDINGKIIQLNQQALTELHVHSSVNTMMPLPTSQIFKLLNNKEDILSTILEKISQGERIYTELYSFTSLPNLRSERVMQKIGMTRMKEFDHPLVPADHPLRKHVLYHIKTG